MKIFEKIADEIFAENLTIVRGNAGISGTREISTMANREI